MTGKPAHAVSLAAGLGLPLLLAACGVSSSAPPPTPLPTSTPQPFVPGKVSVAVLHTTGPRTLSRKAPVMTVRLVVRGLHLDASRMGGAPQSKYGHVQIYLDAVPRDAYTTADLKGMVANVAAPAFSLELPAQTLKKEPGSHRLLVTLARNDYVLYHAKPAVIHVTFQ